MIRTLLVDDEHIVRKGLLHILPWTEHGMVVVADVDGAEKAIEWLEREPVDLLVTDLTMPGISGFELVCMVKERFPLTEVVILTCHQDFHYIQEAMRLGAIDYIVKTELDDEKMDRLFRRISERMATKQVRGAWSSDRYESIADPVGYLFISLVSDCTVQELYGIPNMLQNNPIQVSERAWYVEAAAAEYDRVVGDVHPLYERWAVICLHHVKIKEQFHMKRFLAEYERRHAFYVYIAGGATIHDLYQDVINKDSRNDSYNWENVFRSLEWLHHDRVFQDWLNRVTEMRPDPKMLCRLLYETARAWKGLKRFKDAEAYLEEAVTLRCWTQWRDWLTRLRRSIYGALDEAGIGKEMSLSILRSITWMQERLSQGITQEEAAANVHLSRGYFSDCFKRTVGTTFNDFMKLLRIDHARLLLDTSDLLIHDIAQRCGFIDESYFRKLFREDTALTPKEYRERPNKEKLLTIGSISDHL